MSVWDDVVGQPAVVDQLRDAVAAAAHIVDPTAPTGTATGAAPSAAMSHAWLFTGPPGSGRSVAARAFAAALQCPRQGCGQCAACHTALTGTSADVEVVAPEGLSISVAETRELVRRAALGPVGGRWQVLVLEDADRLSERAANALLKTVEEPPPRSVFLLCVPYADDLPPTIRSRCRLVALRTPPAGAVAEVLERRDGVDAAMAAFAARAAQGHVGRALRLARDEEARRRRREVLAVPESVGSVGACFAAAADLVEAAREESDRLSAPVAAAETAALSEALGAGGTRGAGKVGSPGAAAGGPSAVPAGMPRGGAGALSDLARRQKSRATRGQRDALDRALVDLAAFYRDVLAVQLGSPVDLVHVDRRPAIETLAGTGTPESTLRRIEAVLAARTAVDANVAPLLAVEAMALSLRTG